MITAIVLVHAAADRIGEAAQAIAGRLSKIDGVLRTDTHIAFRSYSRRDTEAAFSLGLGDSELEG